MWIAEYDTHGREFPTCVHVTKTTGTMTHGATYVPIEDGKAVREENAKLRDENARLLSCLTDDAENARQILGESRALQDENDKLREALGEPIKCEDCEAMLDCDECLRADASHKAVKALKAENAKLRELVRDWRDFAVGGADSLPDWNSIQADLEARMREFGVEVNG